MYLFGRHLQVKRLLFLCLFFSLIACITECLGHGLDAKIFETGLRTSTVDVHYSDGSPMSFAKVKIWSPEDDSVEFQNGRTDKNGRFSFFPDVGGEWRITVNDGMGHVATLEPELRTIVEGLNKHGAGIGSPERVNPIMYACLGCSLIINAGFLIGRLKEVRGKRPHTVS